MNRRIAAVALPTLQLEIARLSGEVAAVISTREGDARTERDLTGNARLTEVTSEARALGILPGQTIAQARSRAAELEVRVVREAETRRTLERLCESLLAFGSPASFDARTLYVDVTASAHLFADLPRAIARAIPGHAHRVAIASGPTLARARAHFGGGDLPLEAFADELGDALEWLARLGFSRVSDLARAPRRGLGSRLGERAKRVLALAEGIDPAPLRPYVPPEIPEERAELEYGIDSSEAVLFVVKALAERLAQRLEGRGIQTSSIELELSLDKGVQATPSVITSCALPTPVHRASELLSVLRARIERLEIPGPALAITLRARELSPQKGKALHLFVRESKAEAHLAPLAAELAALIGQERVGTLEMVDSHAERTRLVPLCFVRPGPGPIHERRKKPSEEAHRLLSGAPEPLRWLPSPIPLMPAQDTRALHLARTAYVEWWRSRDPRAVDLVARWDARGELAVTRGEWIVGWMG